MKLVNISGFVGAASVLLAAVIALAGCGSGNGDFSLKSSKRGSSTPNVTAISPTLDRGPVEPLS